MQKKHTGIIGVRLFIKKIAKKLFVILLIFLCIIYAFNFLKKNHNPEIILGEYQIPFGNMGAPLSKTELIEEDKYGRCLYSYESSFYNRAFEDFSDDVNDYSTVFAYVIVQKTDKNNIYIYDDLCYEFVKNLRKDNNDVIGTLKEKNDWGKPIDNQKLTALSKELYEETVYNSTLTIVEEDIIEAWENTIGYKTEGYIFDAIFTEAAIPFFVLREVVDYGEAGQHITYGKSYVFHISENKSEIIYSELSQNIADWNNEIHMFKSDALE